MNTQNLCSKIASGLSRLLLIVSIVSSPTCFAGSRDDAIATVKVQKEISGLQVTYIYSITNNSEFPLISFTVGFDHYRGNPELSGPHPKLVKSPAEWDGYVVSLEESEKYEVRWDIRTTSASIKPGQTLRGFAVIPATDDPRLGNSSWTITLEGPPGQASSQLQLVQGPPTASDTVPPSIQVVMTPNVLWPPNRRMVEVEANIAVSDNADPNPIVKLVSVTCNECEDVASDIQGAELGTDDRRFQLKADRIGHRKEGRVYTVIYSATDIAGNTATAQATVTIPHDQRKPK